MKMMHTALFIIVRRNNCILLRHSPLARRSALILEITMNWIQKRYFGARLDPVVIIRLTTFGMDGDLKATSKTAMVFRVRMGSIIIARMLVQEHSTSSILLLRILINPTAAIPARGTIAPSVLLKLKLMMENFLPLKTVKGCERPDLVCWARFSSWRPGYFQCCPFSFSFGLTELWSLIVGKKDVVGLLICFCNELLLFYAVLLFSCTWFFICFLPLSFKNRNPNKWNEFPWNNISREPDENISRWDIVSWNS